MAFPLGRAQPVSLGDNATGKSKSLALSFDFTTSATAQPISLNFDDVQIDAVRGIFIDNSANNSSVAVTVSQTGQVVYVPPTSQAFYPLLCAPPTIQLSAKSAGGVVVPVQLLSFKPDLMVWSVQAAGNVTNTVTVTGGVNVSPLISTFTNRSSSLAAAGVSQTLAALNAARKRIIIQNPTDETGQGIAAREPLFINFTSAAGVNDGVSLELQPGAVFDTGIGPCTSELIAVNATTIGHKFIVKEM